MRGCKTLPVNLEREVKIILVRLLTDDGDDVVVGAVGGALEKELAEEQAKFVHFIYVIFLDNWCSVSNIAIMKSIYSVLHHKILVESLTFLVLLFSMPY